MFSRSINLVLVFLLGFLVPQITLGLDNPNKIEASYGQKKLANSTISDILHHGRIDLDHMNITGQTRVNGTLNAENSTFQDVTINGRGNIENSTVTGNIRTNGMLNLTKVKVEGLVEVSGFVEIDSANIKGELIVASDKIEIKNATLFRIRVRPTLAMLNKVDPSKEKQSVILTNTKVLGNVIFENENGEIIQQKSSILGSIVGVKEQNKNDSTTK